MSSTTHFPVLDQGAGHGAVAPFRPIGLTGKERASYLQGLLTNDIVAVRPGHGCYAAWLTAQGRMLTDLHVLESGDLLLLDVPAAQHAATLERLDRFLFSEDVQIVDLSASLADVRVHGVAAPRVLGELTGAPGLSGWVQYQNQRLALAGESVVVARIDELGVPGFVVYLAPDARAAVVGALESAGVGALDPRLVEAARIQAGYPVFGVDMTDDTIPLEAGIESRAISQTKGCYVGQEVVIRVLHRGGGRVVRRLVSLAVSGPVPASGQTIRGADRDIGRVTSAAEVPGVGTLALGYVHRDFAAEGTAVQLVGPDGPSAAVVRHVVA